MTDAIKNWEKQDKRSTFSKIIDTVKKPDPLRERISFTIALLIGLGVGYVGIPFYTAAALRFKKDVSIAAD